MFTDTKNETLVQKAIESSATSNKRDHGPQNQS